MMVVTVALVATLTVLKFSRQQNSMKFSQADSCVKIWGFSDISGTISVPIFRVCWWFGIKIFTSWHGFLPEKLSFNSKHTIIIIIIIIISSSSSSSSIPRLHCINGHIAPPILNLTTSSRWMASLIPQSLFSQKESPQYPINRRLGESYSWSECSTRDKSQTVSSSL